MEVRLLRPWLRYGAGAVINLGEEVNAKLVESGKAEPVTAQATEIERAPKPKEKK